MFEMIPVESSNLQAVGYDDNQHILQVEFKNSTVYQYFNVERYIFDGLLSAESKGKYFDQNIKKAGYSYSEI